MLLLRAGLPTVLQAPSKWEAGAVKLRCRDGLLSPVILKLFNPNKWFCRDLPLDWVPLDEDLLSLELPGTFKASCFVDWRGQLCCQLGTSRL